MASILDESRKARICGVEMPFKRNEQEETQYGGFVIIVKVCKPGVSAQQIREELLEAITVKLAKNRSRTDIRGSFTFVVGRHVIAVAHIVPRDACREHRLFYSFGRLRCSGVNCPRARRTHESGCNRSTESSTVNTDSSDILHSSDVSNRSEESHNLASLDSTNDDGFVEQRHDDSGRRWTLTKHFTPTWLERSELLYVATPTILSPVFQEMSVKEVPCFRTCQAIQCSPVVFYPMPVQTLNFVVHVMMHTSDLHHIRGGRNKTCSLVSSDDVVGVLKTSGQVLKGISKKTRQENTFLFEKAEPGTYEVALALLNVAVHVVVLRYERDHAGHRGRFACGYSYFLCGLTSSTPYRVLVRGELKQTSTLDTRRPPHGYSGALPGLSIAASRSYGGDCELIRELHRGRDRAYAPRSHMAPLPCLPNPHVAPSLSYWLTSLVKQRASSPNPAAKQNSASNGYATLQQPALGAGRARVFCEIGQGDSPAVTSGHETEPGISCNKPTIQDWSVATVLLKDNTFTERTTVTEAVCGECQTCSAFRSDQLSPKCSLDMGTSSSGYIAQRFRLVSKYSDNLQLSEQAWFSICPEGIAKHIGTRLAKLGSKLQVMEPFCGAGGNAVQCARMPHVDHVYAFDIDSKEIESAKRLAELYNVTEKITFGTKDVMTLKPDLFQGKSIDAIVFSPPWGGPKYKEQRLYDINMMGTPKFSDIIHHLEVFTKNMAILMPRNSCLDQFAQMALAIHSHRVELEQNLLNDRIKTVTVYYGELANT